MLSTNRKCNFKAAFIIIVIIPATFFTGYAVYYYIFISHSFGEFWSEWNWSPFEYLFNLFMAFSAFLTYRKYCRDKQDNKYSEDQQQPDSRKL